VQADEQREVCGSKVKNAPTARYFDGTKPDDEIGIQGNFKLHDDGIRFRYKQLSHGGFEYRWEFMHFHISTIARAIPGDKSHWLVLEMKDGRMIRFKFAGAAKWADLINKNLA
jgi:hypothetical protein